MEARGPRGWGEARARRPTWVGSAGRCVSFGFCLESRRPSPALLESHWALAVSAQRDPGCCLLELGAYP